MKKLQSAAPVNELTQIKQVGVCVDRSDVGRRILPYAIAITKALGAKLQVMHVLAPPTELPESTPTDPLEWELQRKEAHRHLASLESELLESGLSVQTDLLEGHPAEEVRDWVRSEGIDLTVLCTHGTSGLTEWSLASTARKLIEGISGSIFLVPASSAPESPEHEIAFSRILVPLDGSPRAESVLPLASTIARGQDSDVELIHIVPRPEHSCPYPHDAEELDLEKRLVERNSRAATAYLTALGEQISAAGVRHRNIVRVNGDVRGELIRCIAEDHIDLVVFSGHGYGGRAELPCGNVALFLLEHATTPLLMVRECTPRFDRDTQKYSTWAETRLPQLGSP